MKTMLMKMWHEKTQEELEDKKEEKEREERILRRMLNGWLEFLNEKKRKRLNERISINHRQRKEEEKVLECCRRWVKWGKYK